MGLRFWNVWGKIEFGDWINNCSNLNFDLCLGPLSVTVSFISVFGDDTWAVCSWNDLTHLCISQRPSPAHLSQPSSLQNTALVLDLIDRGCFFRGLGWGAWWAGDLGVSQPSRSGALFSFPYFLFCPDSWKLESIGKYSRCYARF